MKFQNLNRKLEKLDRSYNGDSKPAKLKGYSLNRKKRGFKKLLIKLLVILLILAVLIYIPARGVYSSSKALVNSARALSVSAKNENLDEIRKNLKEMKEANQALGSSLNWAIWVRFIPFVGGYYVDAKKFTNAADFELDAALVLTDSLDPYKGELGFDGNPTPGQDRIAQFVKILDKINPKLSDVEPQLKSAREEVEGIDVGKYPEKIGKYNLRLLLDTAKNLIIGAHVAVTEARGALEIAPSALGEPTAKNYLIIFQNDKELRATGGFMTAYAYLKLDKGRITSSTSDDIYRLDERLLATCVSKVCPLTPPAPIVKYLPEVSGKPRTTWSMRDSNLSPDVPTSLGDFERMYKLLGEGLPFDGIILIDTHVVEELIKITGPVEVFGTTYSAEVDKRCNCPNVIYELENYAQIIERGEQDRKAILGTLMQQILARSLGTSTEKMPEFINAGVKLANAKHVLFYMHDGKTQDALSDLNWTGEIKDPSTGSGQVWDYLHINDSNFAGGKSNLYVTQNVDLEVERDNSGKVKNKLTIKYENPQVYNTWLNGINRNYFRVYVPKGARLLSSKGSEAKVETIEEELGKTVFDGFIQIRPQSSVTVILEYELPGEYSGDEYPILIQKQPGTKDYEYEIKFNGKTKEKFKLDSDKEFKMNI